MTDGFGRWAAGIYRRPFLLRQRRGSVHHRGSPWPPRRGDDRRQHHFRCRDGVSIAAAAAFSRIAYPEMMKVDYRQTYALGAVAGSACLGMLIPPSILLIVWAILTEMSVGALFIAGVVPGLILALLFGAYAILAAVHNPAIAPRRNVQLVEMTRSEIRSEAIGGFGVLFLVLLVIGGIWGGLFTPTEAAGVGALGALAVGVIKGMRRREIIQAIYQAGRTTAPIMFLLITAQLYSRLLAMGGAVNQIRDLLLTFGLDSFLIIAVMALIWLVLGMLIDSVSIILLTLPISRQLRCSWARRATAPRRTCSRRPPFPATYAPLQPRNPSHGCAG